MKTITPIIVSTLLAMTGSAFCQTTGFEHGIPPGFGTRDGGTLATSTLYYKEGKQSLEWQFEPNSTLTVAFPAVLPEEKGGRQGITLWIYNEKAGADSLVFRFSGPDGAPSYQFAFRLAAAGWRACWIAFEHMHGNKGSAPLTRLHIQAPARQGRVFLDRLTLPAASINQRTTPDAQLPGNNSLASRNLWHWCRLWEWEQYTYDFPAAPRLSDADRQAFARIEQRLDAHLRSQTAPAPYIRKAYELFAQAGITPSGAGFTGAPVVAPDELNRAAGELSWTHLDTMLLGFASDYVTNGTPQAETNYFTVWQYAIDQGFAYGSGMGTNHHYGYRVRGIYTSAWLMREAIYRHPAKNDILGTLAFWSGLQETRHPYRYGRDELLDTWHTLLMPKIVAALLTENEREKEQAFRGLSRWLSTSLTFTPGTLGGIKPDGTTFHHGGFYPAYTTGALGAVGTFLGLTFDTGYTLTPEARRVLRTALYALRTYSAPTQWGIGFGGRHPFKGGMQTDDIEAFGYLALAGDLSGTDEPADRELAAEYLRLETRDTPLARRFHEAGIRPAAAPEGFFVFNYGAAGIFRRNGWMVALKGYNTDVWGAEIYTRDNRYGRYQSYGSVQIFGRGAPDARQANGYEEAGWDWNRLPGVTAVHLPLDSLDSPLPGTTMAHSKENFAGCSSFGGRHGIFAIKLMERGLPRFTADFRARKSVFCFDNRMVCLGSGICNTNDAYPTETALFQHAVRMPAEGIRINGKKVRGKLRETVLPAGENGLWDGFGNYYLVRHGEVYVQVADQRSRHDKTREETHGRFASAWISHGRAPQNGRYEYAVRIQPSPGEVAEMHGRLPYVVAECSDTAHIVRDLPTGITGYAVFEDYTAPAPDDTVRFIGRETLVLLSREGNRLLLSVCDPNLNIAEKTYTTAAPSRVLVKRLRLRGRWRPVAPLHGMRTEVLGNDTWVEVDCRDGRPVEFGLEEAVTEGGMSRQ